MKVKNMTYWKTKNEATPLPGIKVDKSTNKKDGRPASSAFQQAKSEADSTKVHNYRKVSHDLNQDLVDKLQDDISKIDDKDPRKSKMLELLNKEIKIKNLSENTGEIKGLDHFTKNK